MKHKDTGSRCLTAHYDQDFNLLPGCIVCSCGEYVRPEDWEKHLRWEARNDKEAK